MILLNFSHPLTDAQRARLEQLTGQPAQRTVEVPAQFDEQAPFAPQLQQLLERVPLSPAAWQAEPLLVVLPSLNFIAALLLAELHGRMGYFPSVVRLRPIANSLPRQYEVAEILDLQAARDAARRQR
jgi:hypothetical protein